MHALLFVQRRPAAITPKGSIRPAPVLPGTRFHPAARNPRMRDTTILHPESVLPPARAMRYFAPFTAMPSPPTDHAEEEFMGKSPEKMDPKQVKAVSEKSTVSLEAWYKRNSGRIKLIDSLALDCDLCKTKEAKDLLHKEIDLTLKDLRGETDKLNKLNESIFKDVPKPTPDDLEKQIKDAYEKLTTIYNKDGVKLKIKFDPKKLTKEPPKLELEIKF
jgi:hypothetical protein